MLYAVVLNFSFLCFSCYSFSLPPPPKIMSDSEYENGGEEDDDSPTAIANASLARFEEPASKPPLKRKAVAYVMSDEEAEPPSSSALPWKKTAMDLDENEAREAAAILKAVKKKARITVAPPGEFTSSYFPQHQEEEDIGQTSMKKHVKKAPAAKVAKVAKVSKSAKNIEAAASKKRVGDEIMRMTFRQGNVFKVMMDTVGSLCTELNWDFTEAGLDISGMDSAHVSLVHASIGTGHDPDYVCLRPCTIGVNHTSLMKITKTITPSAAVVIFLREGEEDKLNIEVYNAQDTYITYEFKLMDIEADKLKPEDYPPGLRLTGSSKMFETHISTLVGTNVGSMAIIGAKSGVVLRTSEDCQVDDIAAKILWNPATKERNPEAYMDLEHFTNTKISLSLKYMSLFSKASKLSEDVKIFIPAPDSTDSIIVNSPIKILYEASEDTFIAFYLAPKVDESDW